jgi:HAD superfamily hydrolase (TIGR01548 family)
MSKAWGLAGLRVGFAIGPPEIVECLRVAGQPYAVSGPSIVLACAKLEAGNDAVESYVDRVRHERRELESLLPELGAEPQPSQANFVFARTANATWLRDGLAGLGIAVRIWPGHAELEGCLRISCPGQADDFDRLTHGLRAVARPQALLLDMDGVLADVSKSYRQAILSTAARWDVELTQEEVSLAKARGNANNDWLLTQALLAARGVEVPFLEVKETFERIYQGTAGEPGLWRTESMIPTRALLERVAARIPLGLVTGRPRADADRFLEANEIAGLFCAKVTMEDGRLKPDPAPVRLALERLGVERAWMVGDTRDDITAARGARVVPLAVIAPGEERDRAGAALLNAGAARVLRDLDALEEMLP